jgi:hypothetical protein
MTTNKCKNIGKKSIKYHKRVCDLKKRFEDSTLRFSGTFFRLLAFQPLSLTLEISKPFDLTIQNINCRFALRPMHSNECSQLTHGGTFIIVEFSLGREIDLLAATQNGLDLIEDFIAAISLIEGAPFRDVKPVQVMCIDQTIPQKYTFLHFLDLSMHHWHSPVSQKTIQDVRGLLSHWDGLESGKRLRRAARQFQKAIGTEDNLVAFQYAYMGLEAIEKPLADVMNIQPGAEEVEGTCEKCGAKYVRRRTVLAGVRAYVSGAFHSDTVMPENKREWKEINDLRHELFHSLQDNQKSEQKVSNVLPAAMHHLHDAICCLSHSHNLESPTFKLVRGMNSLVSIGRFNAVEIEPLEEWSSLLDAEHGYWVPHPQFGFVPRFKMHNHGLENLEVIFYWLNASPRRATIDNLVPANWEDK